MQKKNLLTVLILLFFLLIFFLIYIGVYMNSRSVIVSTDNNEETQYYFSNYPLEEQIKDETRYLSLTILTHRKWRFGHILNTHPQNSIRVTFVLENGELLYVVGDANKGDMLFFDVLDFKVTNTSLENLHLFSDSLEGYTLELDLNKISLSNTEQVENISEYYLVPNTVGWR